MAPQRLEKIESAPGNGMGSEASNPQHLGLKASAADRAPPRHFVRLIGIGRRLCDTQKQVSQFPVRHCDRELAWREAIQGPQYDRLGCWRRACCGPWIASSQGLLAMTGGSSLTR
jgi:hypothetical protein